MDPLTGFMINFRKFVEKFEHDSRMNAEGKKYWGREMIKASKKVHGRVVHHHDYRMWVNNLWMRYDTMNLKEIMFTLLSQNIILMQRRWRRKTYGILDLLMREWWKETKGDTIKTDLSNYTEKLIKKLGGSFRIGEFRLILEDSYQETPDKKWGLPYIGWLPEDCVQRRERRQKRILDEDAEVMVTSSKLKDL